MPPPPPVGSAELTTFPLLSIATHNPGTQEIADNAFAPSTFTGIQALASVGFADGTTSPLSSIATHREAEAHETPVGLKG
jgi:hypothetical protein